MTGARASAPRPWVLPAEIGLGTMIGGTILLLIGELAISVVNNLSSPPSTLAALAVVELCFVGAILLGVGYVGVTRNLRSARGGLRTWGQGLGFFLGVASVAGLLFAEGVLPAPYGLTVYGMTAALVAGLTLLCVSIDSSLRPEAESPQSPGPMDFKGFV